MLNLHQPGGSVGGGALADGSNVTNPATWQANLGVPSVLDSRRRTLIGGQPGVSFDGVTTGSRITATLTAQPFSGTGDFSVWVRFRVPTANPSGSSEVVVLSDSATSPFTANAFYLDMGTNGSLSLIKRSGSSVSQTAFQLFNVVSTYAGQVIDAVVTRVNQAWKLYINGTDVTPTSPSYADETVSFTYLHLGAAGSAQCFNDRIYRVAVFNRGLSASEVTDLIVNGVSYADQWGTQTKIVSGATGNGNFETWTSAGVAGTSNGVATNWTIDTVLDTITRNNVNPISGSYDALITTSPPGGGHYAVLQKSYTAAGILAGKRYRIAWKQKLVSGSATALQTGFVSPSQLFESHPLSVGVVQSLSREFVAPIGPTAFRFLLAQDNSAVQLDEFELERIGALVDLNLGEGAGLCFPDRSTNNLHGIGFANVSHIVPGRQGCVRVRTTASGNTQLGGAGILPANARIRCVTADAVSGTPTVTMGNASGGAQHVASVALTAGLNDLTVAARFSATGNLWVNVSTTATVDWTVLYDLVD